MLAPHCPNGSCRYVWAWLKFGHSEKDIKFEKNLPLKIWPYSVVSNFKWKIFSNFVFFSECPNFTQGSLILVEPVSIDVLHKKLAGQLKKREHIRQKFNNFASITSTCIRKQRFLHCCFSNLTLQSVLTINNQSMQL